MVDGLNVEISPDSPIAREACAMARDMLAAKSLGLAAALTLPLDAAVARILVGIRSSEDVAERTEFLGCLLSSLCHLAVVLAPDAATLAETLRQFELNGWTF
jgi:hypothetical protein